MQIDIRTMQLKDAPAVNQLSKQFGYALTAEQTANQIAIILEEKEHTACVAANDDVVIGWIHAFQTFTIESLPFVEVGGLIVDEMYRGKGVGKALINHVRKWCAEQGIHTLRVRTQLKRLEAHSFYKALRFEEVKEQKVFQLKIQK